MGGDDLSDRVGIDQAGIEGKGNKMVVEDIRLEVQVCGDESPGYKEGDETKKCTARFIAACSTGLDDVLGTGRC